MKKMALIFFVLTLLYISVAFSKCKNAYFDIIQGKNFKENTVIAEIEGEKYSLFIKGDLAQEDVQEKILEWFDNLSKEKCE